MLRLILLMSVAAVAWQAAVADDPVTPAPDPSAQPADDPTDDATPEPVEETSDSPDASVPQAASAGPAIEDFLFSFAPAPDPAEPVQTAVSDATDPAAADAIDPGREPNEATDREPDLASDAFAVDDEPAAVIAAAPEAPSLEDASLEQPSPADDALPSGADLVETTTPEPDEDAQPIAASAEPDVAPDTSPAPEPDAPDVGDALDAGTRVAMAPDLPDEERPSTTADPASDSGPDLVAGAEPDIALGGDDPPPADPVPVDPPAPFDTAGAIDAVNAYLNALGPIQGRFQMSDASSAAQFAAATGAPPAPQTGAFYLVRSEAKMRLEFDPPTVDPDLIVIDGVEIASRYTEFKREIERVSLSVTPLKLLLGGDVDLTRDTRVNYAALSQDGSRFFVTLTDPAGDVDGSMSLVFDWPTITLREWVISDGFEQTIRVSLADVTEADDLDESLFRLRDTRRRRGG